MVERSQSNGKVRKKKIQKKQNEGRDWKKMVDLMQ